MKKKRVRIRTVVQIVFVVLIAAIAINHSLEESGNSLPVLSTASLHAVCPFGGVVSIYQYATQATFTQKIHESSFVLMIIVFLLAVAFGPVFCGWICPMGSIQEWIGKLGARILGKRRRKWSQKLLPYKVDTWLRYLRYVVLAWVVFVTARSGQLIFADYDPYYALFNFWTGEVAISGLIILGIVLLLSLLVERPFCKYACPYGAVLGLFNFVRIFKIRRNPSTCISCSACTRACPMNIQVESTEVVRNHQCISCLECTSEAACPVAETVELTTGAFHAPADGNPAPGTPREEAV